MSKPEPNVQPTTDSRPPDWAWQRAQRMHETNAAEVDRAAEQERNRDEAQAERRRARPSAERRKRAGQTAA